jgi:hypothetical protein
MTERPAKFTLRILEGLCLVEPPEGIGFEHFGGAAQDKEVFQTHFADRKT